MRCEFYNVEPCSYCKLSKWYVSTCICKMWYKHFLSSNDMKRAIMLSLRTEHVDDYVRAVIKTHFPKYLETYEKLLLLK